MMIGRAVGWMEWSGLVKGRAGDGDGDGDGDGEGEGRGEGGVPTDLWGGYDAIMTGLCVCSRNKRVLLKHIIVHL